MQRQMTTVVHKSVSVPLGLKALGWGLIASLAMMIVVERAHASDGYQAAVLADNPIFYLQFNEDPGATQVVDSSNSPDFGDTPNGGSKDSQYVGTRTERFDDAFGFELLPGQGVTLGGTGPVGRAVRFQDPDDFKSQIVPGSDLGGDDPGGYIETGLHYNFGPAGNVRADGSNTGPSIGWTVEFLYRDDFLQPGDNNTESIASQGNSLSPNNPNPDFGNLQVGTGAINFTGNSTGSFGIATDEREPTATGTFAPEIETFYGGGRTYASQIPAGGQTAENSPIVEGEWQHIALTFQQSSRTLRWYVNGVETNEQVAANTANPNTDTPLILGASGNFFFGRQYYDGFLDEFAVYDYRLDDPNNDGDESDSRIAAHFAELDLFAGIDGGFDSDSDVDGADFLSWQRGESSGRLVNGDLNPAELADWQANFGQDTASASAAAASVPEPASLLLMAAGAMMMTLGRRRRC